MSTTHLAVILDDTAELPSKPQITDSELSFSFKFNRDLDFIGSQRCRRKAKQTRRMVKNLQQ